ncbi:MAG: hypothetical protein FJ291_21980 [Planctomycetes bacterium]|nr:hypothetical protein [Planctomycetota bacterium]
MPTSSPGPALEAGERGAELSGGQKQRLSTILEATHIVVLDQGRIVEIGPRDEPLARNGVYRKLYDAQVGGMLAPRPDAPA